MPLNTRSLYGSPRNELARLKALAGLSVNDIAEALGLSPHTVKTYLKGRDEVPRSFIVNMAELLQVPVDAIAGADGCLLPPRGSFPEKPRSPFEKAKDLASYMRSDDARYTFTDFKQEAEIQAVSLPEMLLLNIWLGSNET